MRPAITTIITIAFLTATFICSNTCAGNNANPKKKDTPEKKMNIFSIETKLSEQKLYVMRDNQIFKQYPISSSKFGIGSEAGSNKTPLGKHIVREKIGAGAPINTIFKSRVDTKKIAQVCLEPKDTGHDYVTTRILWLEGIEEGINKGNGIDSYRRNIYIHGTPEEGLIGTPASHGCIRMRNKDVMELFDLIPTGTKVEIKY